MSKKLELAKKILAEMEKEKTKPRIAPSIPSMGTRMLAAQKSAMTRAGAAPAKAPKKRSS
jgi:hypothetical protein